MLCARCCVIHFVVRTGAVCWKDCSEYYTNVISNKRFPSHPSRGHCSSAPTVTITVAKLGTIAALVAVNRWHGKSNLVLTLRQLQRTAVLVFPDEVVKNGQYIQQTYCT